MAGRSKIPQVRQEQVRQRANFLCEYCHAIETALFNPRHDRRQDHFIWSVDGLMMLGLTPTGRATVDALLLNRERIINIRAADMEIGRHPPVDDPEIRGIDG